MNIHIFEMTTTTNGIVTTKRGGLMQVGSSIGSFIDLVWGRTLAYVYMKYDVGGGLCNVLLWHLTSFFIKLFFSRGIRHEKHLRIFPCNARFYGTRFFFLSFCQHEMTGSLFISLHVFNENPNFLGIFPRLT